MFSLVSSKFLAMRNIALYSVTLFSGLLRERIKGSKVVQLKPNIVWDSYLSECPFLGITKTIFFNDFVKSKGRYVNNVSFYLCAYLEFFILDTLDSLAPNLVPNVLNEICQRWNWSSKYLVCDINPPNNQFCFHQFFHDLSSLVWAVEKYYKLFIGQK